MAYEGVQPSRLGLDATGAAGNEDLFLKVFSGEVLTTFEENNVMMPLHRVRTISSGKTAQFPVTGVASAVYHTPGHSIFSDEAEATNTYASNINHSEKIISIDGVLTSSAFIADIDEAKNHYEVRSIYSTEIGRQLAYHADKAIIRTILGGSMAKTDRFGNAETTVAGQEANKYLGGRICIDGTASGDGANNESSSQALYDTTVATDAGHGQDLYNGIFHAANLMDQKNVPTEGRYCLLPPDGYYQLLTQQLDAINRDFNPNANGSVAAGDIVSVAGVRILKSNHVPQGDESGGSADATLGSSLINNDLFGADSGYSSQDFSTIQGCVFQTEGVGTVKLLDLAMESEYYMERLGTMLLAKYAMGHGILREEACYALVDNT